MVLTSGWVIKKHPIFDTIKQKGAEYVVCSISTLLTVTIRSAVTTAPFRKLTASPVSRACVLAHVGNTHSSAPYHSVGSPKLLYVIAGSTP